MSFAGLAISNIAWSAEDDCEALDLASAAGFTGIELAPVKTFGRWEEITPAQVRARAEVLAARGLPVVALQGILFDVPGAKLFGTGEEREALARHLGLVARIAGACGGVPCVFGAPRVRNPGGLSEADAMELAVAFLNDAAASFAAEGAVLAFEANPTAYECRFVTRTQDAITLVRRVATPGLRLQIDAGTMLINGEDPIWAAEAAPFAAHCHASAPHLAPVADHAAAHVPLATALRAAGYTGWISVEMRAAPDWRAAIRRSGPAMREAWL